MTAGPALAANLRPELVAKLKQRGDLSLSNTPLPHALLTIGEAWEVNIVSGTDVQGQVSGKFADAPLEEILQAVLFANGYAYRAVGQSLVVTPLDALGDVHPLAESATIRLRFVKPADVLAGAKLLASPQGKLQAIDSASSLMVVDLPERVAMIRQFAEQLDASLGRNGGDSADTRGVLEASQFTPQFVDAPALHQAILPLLSPLGKASVMERENRLVVVDGPAAMKLVRKIVRELDVARMQVRITALIYDVSVEDLERLGINWNHTAKARMANGVPQSLWSIESLLQVPAAAGDPSGAMTFMNLGRHIDFTGVVHALRRSSHSKLLADPTVTVVDRELARIQIVSEIPYQQLTQTAAGGNIGTTAFREAGVTLSVSPAIAHDDTIRLEVTPTFSRLAGFTAGASPQPIIDKREAKTVVRVANHQTLVIGGLRQRSENSELRGLPRLMNIRRWGIGKLFRATENSNRESELVVFLTPEIVSPMYPGRAREVGSYHQSRMELDAIPHPVMIEPTAPEELLPPVQAGDTSRKTPPRRRTTVKRPTDGRRVAVPRDRGVQPAAAYLDVPRPPARSPAKRGVPMPNIWRLPPLNESRRPQPVHLFAPQFRD